MRKILKLRKLISALVLFHFVFGVSQAAMAAGLKKAEEIAGGQANSIYYGSFWQSNSSAKEGVKYNVLANEGSTLYVLSQNALLSGQFADHYNESDWRWSKIRTALNDRANGFAKDAFSTAEWNAIPISQVSAAKGIFTDDKIFLPSEGDVYRSAYGFTSDSRRQKAPTWFAAHVAMYGIADADDLVDPDEPDWWLSTADYDDWFNWVGYIDSDGEYDTSEWDYYWYSDYGVVPGFRVNTGSILFATAAEGGKSNVYAGSGFSLADYTGTDYKLTIKDSSIAKPAVTSVSQEELNGVDTLASKAAQGGYA